MSNIERCCECYSATGRAGIGEDSLYLDDGAGPYCEICFTVAEEQLRTKSEIADQDKTGV